MDDGISLTNKTRFNVNALNIGWLGYVARIGVFGCIACGLQCAVAQGTANPNALEGARWIAAGPDVPASRIDGMPAGGEVSRMEALPILREKFTPRGRVVRATLFVSGLGQFEAHVNGHNVTEAVLTPGWSDYRKRIYYDTYDVTQLLRPGQNAIGVMLGNGMYNVESPQNRYTKFRGSFGEPKLIAKLVLRLADGTQQTVVSDGTWKTTPGPVTFSNIYGGEDYDARREQAGWDAPAFSDTAWAPATLVEGPGGTLQPETIPPVIANETYPAVKVTHPKPGVTVYDLGQNMAGWPEIEVSGPAGSVVHMLPGELLDANGLVTQHSMNAFPKNPDYFTYTLKGGAVERWHPRFSYTSFRYVEVDGPVGAADTAEVRSMAGRFVHDAVAVDGQFTSSSDLLNRTHVLIDRAILSNMVSVLTDCPHREKLGWIEQTHLAAASIMFNYNVAALYTKQAADMRDDQTTEGLVPDHVPEYPTFPGDFRDSPEWGAAVILSPWAAYQFYGDAGLLRDQYPAMQRYAAYLKHKAVDHILSYGLGDWYDIGPKPPGRSQLTGAGITATSTYYQELVALRRIADLLGHSADAASYGQEAAAVRTAFNAKFFHTDTNTYDTGSQTALAMPLAVGLVPDGREGAVLANLVADIHAHTDHLTSGEIGFHYVVRALTDNGRSDVLYAMLMRTDKPSYGDQLAHGATTLTEAWDAYAASSQNHFMLGHAEEWFYRGLAGIDVDLSRERDSRIEIRPAIPGDLASASASYRSKLGIISSGWTRAGDTLTMAVTIPAGATAKIVFPAAFSKAILVAGKPLAAGGSVLSADLADTTPHCQVSAGTYRFELHR